MLGKWCQLPGFITGALTKLRMIRIPIKPMKIRYEKVNAQSVG
jgi:hypothetical protein